MALIREEVPAERRARRFGHIGAIVVLAAAGGPPLGGFLVQFAGWPTIFYANILLIAPALLVGLRALPAGRPRQGDRPFDLIGAVLLLVILSGAAWLLTQIRQGNIVLHPALGGSIVVGLAILFLRREWRHPDPVLQPGFFRRRAFASANAGIAFSNLAMYTAFLALPILFSTRPGWTSAQTGLVLAAFWTPTAACAPIGGRLADRWGRRRPTVLGLTLFTLGLLPLALTGGNLPLPILVGGLVLGGIGLGLSSAGLQTAAVEAVGPHEAGVASGMFSTSRYLGSIVGSSILAGLLGGVQGEAGFAAIFRMVFASALISALVSLGLHSRPRRERMPV